MWDKVSETLSKYALSVSYEALGERVIQEIKRRIIDSIGCFFGAWNAEPCRIAREVARRFSSREYGSTLWGTGLKSSADWAAFSNGVGVRFLDFNDTYLSREPLHPSDMIPALIAITEATGKDGRELIEAAAVSYEIGCRLCDAASIRVRGWDHVNYTMIGAVVGVGKLMELDAEKLMNAISLSVVPHIAMRQTRAGELSMWKGAAAANACRNAVAAALLARHGMRGPSQPFEGAMAFFKQVSGKPFDPEALKPLESLEPPSMILKTHIKYHPVEYHAQSAVDAALKLREKVSDVADVSEILIETFEAAYTIIAKDPEKWRPKTRETADHSLPYIVAATLLDGKIWLDSFEPPRLGSREIQQLIKKMRIEEDPELTEKYPDEIPNRITVTLKDGRKVAEEVGAPKGHAKNPMTDQEVEEKFHRLTAPLMDGEKRKRILELIWRFEELENLSPLLEELRLEGG